MTIYFESPYSFRVPIYRLCDDNRATIGVVLVCFTRGKARTRNAMPPHHYRLASGVFIATLYERDAGGFCPHNCAYLLCYRVESLAWCRQSSPPAKRKSSINYTMLNIESHAVGDAYCCSFWGLFRAHFSFKSGVKRREHVTEISVSGRRCLYYMIKAPLWFA